MKGYEGNKTLLPLIPRGTSYRGELPMLVHILGQLPSGPKAVVVNHRREEIVQATRDLDAVYCEQPVTNGTGGALLAARPFLKDVGSGTVIVTMGDVPLVRRETYGSLLNRLEEYPFVILGFEPEDKKRYGLLDTAGPLVRRIVEWTYWHRFPETERDALRVCNAGIYAARRGPLLDCLERLEQRPHAVVKEHGGRRVEIREYFITDLVELMAEDGLETGYVLARDENEVMGVDDPASLRKAQTLFGRDDPRYD
jgi:bifunctional N-acetylglucosamine-1-phosphate-uridyltransferase/glucosamine-1-phosphate-acetyltransferase GlmU-like protein